MRARDPEERRRLLNGKGDALLLQHDASRQLVIAGTRPPGRTRSRGRVSTRARSVDSTTRYEAIHHDGGRRGCSAIEHDSYVRTTTVESPLVACSANC